MLFLPRGYWLLRVQGSTGKKSAELIFSHSYLSVINIIYTKLIFMTGAGKSIAIKESDGLKIVLGTEMIILWVCVYAAQTNIWYINI